MTLSDAPTDSIPDNVNPNDLVIHQQDIDDVMNAMWEGGAEAMTVQGVRIAPRTVVRCIGNVIFGRWHILFPSLQDFGDRKCE